MGTVTYSGSRYEFRGSFDERFIPKDAGWRWDPAGKIWWTDDERKAARLATHSTGDARIRLKEYVDRTAKAMEESRATTSAMVIPAPAGLEYLPYQKAGIAYATERDNVLIADEMGLGKTIQAIGIANIDAAKRILVICPASLRLNWERELRKWLVSELTIGVANGEYFPANKDVVIINYDILPRHREEIDKVEWDLLICDESHYLKTPTARRTAAVLGGEYKQPKRKAASPTK